MTIPDRQMRVRLASAAESAAIPAPHISPPRLIGNTGETRRLRAAAAHPRRGGRRGGFDDFTFAAASWTLTAHEGRPGHELQFSTMVEKGVSLARVLFAFNSVNVEGWALYAEAEMKPYLPLDGQLIALQHRLLRAARAFLDPGLQTGHDQREEAYRVLERGRRALARPWRCRRSSATPSAARVRRRPTSSATAGLMELRTDAERALGDRFDRQAYHDFVLAQGLLSPTLLRKAVVEQHVPQRLGAAPAKTGG